MDIFQRLKWKWLPEDNYQKAISQFNAHRRITKTKSICHAPFTNMYFGHHGVVTACCYNRTHTLGVWPNKSLTEIWWGAKANELRESLSNYDLSKGCIFCEHQLLAHNFDGLKAAQFDSNYINKNDFPSVIEFELDNKCNLECVMCSEEFSSVIAARKGLPTYKTPYNQEYVSQLIPFIPHLKEAKFYGGEPFMIKIYYEIWDLIVKINPDCRISIQTNASIMNDRILKLMEFDNIHLNISIDSLQSDVYHSIRLGADFQETMKNIEFFYRYAKKNNTFFGISACMMRQTAEEAPDFIHYCNQLDIPVYFHTVFQPEILALNTLPKEELELLIQKLNSHNNFKTNTPNQKKNLKHYNDFINQLQFWLKIDSHEIELKHQQPVKDWNDFFERIENACIEVYGKEEGSNKSSVFKQMILQLQEEGFSEEIDRQLSNVMHADLSSSVHKIIDLNKERIKDLLINNMKTKL